MYRDVLQHQARRESAEWQALAAQKRRTALCKRRAGLPYRVGIAFALLDIQGAKWARLHVSPLPR
jgi:hypothetical protein